MSAALSAPGRDTLRQPLPETQPRATWIVLGPAAHRAREVTNHEGIGLQVLRTVRAECLDDGQDQLRVERAAERLEGRSVG